MYRPLSVFVATVLAVVLSPAAGHGQVTCWAAGTYTVCNGGTCTDYSVNQMGAAGAQDAAATSALTSCSNHMTNMVVTNNMNGTASVKVTCAVTSCSGGAAASSVDPGERAGDPSGGGWDGDDADESEWNEAGDYANAKPARDVPQCRDMIRAVCELCGAKSKVCAMYGDLPVLPEDCAGADADMASLLEDVRASDDPKAMAEELCRELSTGF